MSERNRVCPVELAGSLDSKIRRWLQNPVKILKPYVKKDITAMDIGCGPGFFTLPIAQLVGENGRVIAADLQEGMLQKLHQKIKGTELEGRISLHKCEKDKIGIIEKVDFILAFYMVHEIPEQFNFFSELKSVLNPNGLIFIVEPKLFHVSKKAFENMLLKAESAGLKPVEYPHLTLSRAVILN
ncbi:MAG: class I SAM-dependent methyltransferase [Ignavibacteriaceae bacterium]